MKLIVFISRNTQSPHPCNEVNSFLHAISFIFLTKFTLQHSFSCYYINGLLFFLYFWNGYYYYIDHVTLFIVKFCYTKLVSLDFLGDLLVSTNILILSNISLSPFSFLNILAWYLRAILDSSDDSWLCC